MTTTEATPEIDPARARALLHQMIRIRRFEERCVELYSAASVRGFMHLYIGEEAVAAGVLAHLDASDAVVATYREHGHALARGVPMRAVLAEMYGMQEGCSRGRGGSMHVFDAERRFYGGNAIVGGGIPVALGLALADHMAGRPGITACFFGEGAVAEGEFHESMNLAALWGLPVLFCCENNLYAMGTALDRSESSTDMALKAAAYGMAAWSVDGMDALACDRSAEHAVAAIRGGGGPVFLEMHTYRFRAHSMYDPDRYRTKEEIALWKERDPITTFPALLQQHGMLDQALLETIEAEVAAEIDDAVAHAEAGTPEPVESLTRWVYADGSSATGGPR